MRLIRQALGCSRDVFIIGTPRFESSTFSSPKRAAVGEATKALERSVSDNTHLLGRTDACFSNDEPSFCEDCLLD